MSAGINWEKVFWVMLGLFTLCVVLMSALLQPSGGPPPSDTPTYERSAEFDYSYGRCRDSGMSQKDSADVAKATADFLKHQRQQRQNELENLGGR